MSPADWENESLLASDLRVFSCSMPTCHCQAAADALKRASDLQRWGQRSEHRHPKSHISLGRWWRPQGLPLSRHEETDCRDPFSSLSFNSVARPRSMPGKPVWRVETQEGFGVQGWRALICSIAAVSDVRLAKLLGHSQHSWMLTIQLSPACPNWFQQTTGCTSCNLGDASP